MKKNSEERRAGEVETQKCYHRFLEDSVEKEEGMEDRLRRAGTERRAWGN